VGIIVALTKAPVRPLRHAWAYTKPRVVRLAQLNNGEHYSTNRLEVINASV